MDFEELGTRGILHRGPKGTLQRTILGRMFRPVLLSKSDTIQDKFIDVVNECIVLIENHTKNDLQTSLYLWLCHAPLHYFNLLFINGENTEAHFPGILNAATDLDGRACAYCTQAHILLMLERLVEMNPWLKPQIGLYVPDIEKHIVYVHPSPNKILTYMASVRKNSSDESLDNLTLLYMYSIAGIIMDDKSHDNLLKNIDFIKVMRIRGRHFDIETEFLKRQMSIGGKR